MRSFVSAKERAGMSVFPRIARKIPVSKDARYNNPKTTTRDVSSAFLFQDCIRHGVDIWAVDGRFGTQREWCDAIPRYERSLPSGLHGAEDIPRMRRDKQEFSRLRAEVRRRAPVRLQIRLEPADGVHGKRFVEILG